MITDSAGITGPSQAFAIVGNPSPIYADNLQVVTTQQASFTDSIWSATKAAFATITGSGAATVSAKATEGIAVGIKNAGSAIKDVAGSAASGIRIGFVLLVVVGGIILLAQFRRATG